MQEQPVVNRTLVGPAAWPHSQFHLTVEKLKTSGFKLMLPPEETVRRFEAYCNFVERHGQWHTETAVQEGMLDAKLVHQSVKNHRKLLPLHYWRTVWPPVDITPREDRTKTPEASKSEVAALNKRVVVMENTLQQAVTNGAKRAESMARVVGLLEEKYSTHEAIIDTLNNDVGLLIKSLHKPVEGGPSHLTRFHRELRRRLHVLVLGGK